MGALRVFESREPYFEDALTDSSQLKYAVFDNAL
jgi:hypothetical protein